MDAFGYKIAVPDKIPKNKIVGLQLLECHSSGQEKKTNATCEYESKQFCFRGAPVKAKILHSNICFQASTTTAQYLSTCSKTVYISVHIDESSQHIRSSINTTYPAAFKNIAHSVWNFTISFEPEGEWEYGYSKMEVIRYINEVIL